MNAETAKSENDKDQKPEDKENKTEESATQEAKPQDNDKTDESKPESSEKVKKSSAAVNNLRVLENIEVRLTVEVGNTEIKIKDLLRLNEGSVVELDRLAGDPLDILANGTRIAKGEVVMVGEKFGIRFTEVVAPEEMVQNL